MTKKPSPTAIDPETNSENGPEAQAPATDSATPTLGNEGAQIEAAGADNALAAEGQRLAPGYTFVVIGPAKGRWRAGRHFTQEPVSIALEELTEAELAALRADPELAVSGDVAQS